MTALVAALLAAAQGSGDETGLVLERTVQVTTLDWLGRRRDVHRRESIRIKGNKVAVVDLTFGERLVIRGDLRKVWKADPLRGEYSEYGFDALASIRKAALDEIRAAKARVPGTADERELEALLEGYDQFASEPRAELLSVDARRELRVNGDRVRLSAAADARIQPVPGYFEALGSIGAFPQGVTGKLRELGGLPEKGTIRYLLFLDRVVERYEVTAARREPLDEAEFELPKGLARVPLRGFERPADRRPAAPAPFRKDFKEDDRDRPGAGAEEPRRTEKP